MAGGEMILFKACPRCRGDVVQDCDQYGLFNSCLACGYVGYPDAQNQIGQPVKGASMQWFAEVGGFLAVEAAQGHLGRATSSNWVAVNS